VASDVISSLTDFSGGEIHGISDIRRKVRHARIIENGILEPLGGVGVRKGSQRLSSATLTKKPHTVTEWVSASGSSKCFVVSEDTAGVLNELTTVAVTAQTTPFALHASAKAVCEQQNGAMFLTQFQGTGSPIFYRTGNPANKWHSMILPRPAFPAIPTGLTVTGAGLTGGPYTVNVTVNAGDVTLTLNTGVGVINNDGTITIGSGTAQFTIPNVRSNAASAVLHYQSAGAAANTVMTLTGAGGGGLTAASTYWYRLRFRYLDGSSKATAPQSIAMGANTQVQLTTIANEVRSDYLGWTLERTTSQGSVIGPFYFVTDQPAGTVIYNDVIADADLGYRSDENLHGEPPHFDGLVSFRDRLVGWVGSNIWLSQSVADVEATGICNWNALNATPAGPDDGDIISLVLKQSDRLCIAKRWSIWVAEGDDIQSLRVFDIYKGAGAGGCRAACAVGSVIYFHGDAGFHRIVGNDVKPFGYTEEGDTFKAFRSGQNTDVKVVNYLNQQVLVFFSTAAAYNDDGLMYDLRFGGWTRIKGWYIADCVVQKAGNFGDAHAMLSVDRRDLDAGAGFDYPVWLSFYGFQDEKAADASGGTPPSWVLETPMMDDGLPANEKEWQRIQLFLRASSSVTATVTLILDPQQSVSRTLSAPQSSATWGAPTTWGSFVWGTDQDAGPYAGLPAEARGRRYALRVVVSPPGDLAFKGYEMRGKLRRAVDFSRAT
jgi:hypothetical protein